MNKTKSVLRLVASVFQELYAMLMIIYGGFMLIQVWAYRLNQSKYGFMYVIFPFMLLGFGIALMVLMIKLVGFYCADNNLVNKEYIKPQKNKTKIAISIIILNLIFLLFSLTFVFFERFGIDLFKYYGPKALLWYLESCLPFAPSLIIILLVFLSIRQGKPKGNKNEQV